ncbi:hypothetical protein PTKIN_Ptkin01aG0104700 [Pterospermum kingtungense]
MERVNEMYTGTLVDEEEEEGFVVEGSNLDLSLIDFKWYLASFGRGLSLNEARWLWTVVPIFESDGSSSSYGGSEKMVIDCNQDSVMESGRVMKENFGVKEGKRSNGNDHKGNQSTMKSALEVNSRKNQGTKFDSVVILETKRRLHEQVPDSQMGVACDRLGTIFSEHVGLKKLNSVGSGS